jgi:hypothetical protein
MHEREYKRLRATIEADYRKKIDALDLIYNMAGGSAIPSSNGNRSQVKGALAQGVVAAISQTTGDFNVRDLEESLRIMYPTLPVKRASLSNTLKRLEGKEIEVVERGSGKRASVFRRKMKA